MTNLRTEMEEVYEAKVWLMNSMEFKYVGGDDALEELQRCFSS